MPHLATFQQGCVAAAGLFAVIERKPAQVNASSDSHDGEAAADAAEMQLAPAAPGMIGARQLAPAGCPRGDLELSNISFAYPARPERPVLEGLNLTFPAGQWVVAGGQ